MMNSDSYLEAKADFTVNSSPGLIKGETFHATKSETWTSREKEKVGVYHLLSYKKVLTGMYKRQRKN